MALSSAQARASKNELLTTVALNHVPGDFPLLNDIIAPPMDKPDIEKGEVEVWTRKWLQASNDQWDGIGPGNVVKYDEPTLMSFHAGLHAETIFISDVELKRREKAGVSPEAHRSARIAEVTHNLLLNRELALATKINTAANYTSGYTVTITSPQWSASTNTMIDQIQAAKRAGQGGGFPFNKMLVTDDVFSYMEVDSGMVNMMKEINRSSVDAAGIKARFGLDLIVASGRYDSAGTLTSIYQDSAIFFYQPTVPPPSSEGPPTFLRTINSQPLMVEEWDDRPAYRGTWYRVSMGYCHQFMAVDNATNGDTIAGYLLDNVI